MRRTSLTRLRVAAVTTDALLALAPLGTTSAAPEDWADVPPKGANNWSCRSTTHPVPVVLVHGTTANQNQNWATLSPALTKAGYCVYTFTYGELPGLPGYGGLGPIRESVKTLVAFASKVRQRTGADKLDFIGHSQGASIQMMYLRDYQGAKHTRRVINLAGVVNGAPSVGGLSALFAALPPAVLGNACPACAQLIDPEATRFGNHPTIAYANIASRTDEVVNPVSVSLMKPAPNVRNIVVQNYCPTLSVGHDAMSKDPTVRRIILNELDPAARKPVKCRS
ncbi:alpha/beta fold hydrolase [Gordonia crocea]|uniref:Lipase n=1 Tax=Gordonia crocea TaxID=589162 RepID=A0A7M3SUS9_9ACTN|nr:alpha/beta fold hydrolase [Gordonia crocea]GED96403.1 lipase [Gordonia crocea]